MKSSTAIATPLETSPETPDIETASSAYARRFAGPVGDYFLQMQTEIVLQLLRPWPGASVLDLGGGHGQLAVPLVQHGFKVTVVGSSDACQTRLSSLLPAGSFQFEQSNLTATPFPAGSFDIVLSFRLLTHLSGWRTAVAEMCRVARHAVILDYPDVRSLNVLSPLLFRVKKSLEGDTRLYRNFRAREILTEVTAGGFGGATLRRQFFFPMAARVTTLRPFRESTMARVN